MVLVFGQISIIAIRPTCRTLGAWFCLFALFALQAPVLAALVVASGACCTRDRCPIAAHHHAAAKADDSSMASMDCDHNMAHGVNKMPPCSISCCDSTEQPAVHSTVFLLSPVIELASVNLFPEAIPSFEAGETALYFAPLSPPPKSLRSLI
jgi:hypothetical protein